MGLKLKADCALRKLVCAPFRRAAFQSVMSFSYSPSFFQHFPKYHAPHLHPGEEVVCPTEELKPKCLTACHPWLSEYNDCVTRISLRSDGKGDCKGQYEELSQCQDHCIAHEAFG